MATLASASRLPDLEMPARLPHPRLVPPSAANESGEPAEVYQRSVYQPSRKSAPMAVLASAGMIGAALAALATLNIVAKHGSAERLTVVEMRQLDTTPPPPPPETLAKPVEVAPQAFVPKPMIELPSPGPTQVAIDAPPPPAPLVQAVAPAPEAPAPAPASAPAAPAAPSSAPVEGGDLSSQVLSAKPPVYPVDSRRAREQGTVKLLVLVGPDGRVSDISVSGSSGSKRLDQAALSAVRRWRWSPTKRNGTAVAVRGYVTIPFVLV